MKKISTEEIGDGKLPNKYWVSVSNDYFYFNADPNILGWDWISDLNLFPVTGETLAVFNTYQEAREYVDNLEQKYNTITIEDRLSGELFIETKYLSFQSGISHIDSYEDLQFTIDTLEEKGQRFI